MPTSYSIDSCKADDPSIWPIYFATCVVPKLPETDLTDLRSFVFQNFYKFEFSGGHQEFRIIPENQNVNGYKQKLTSS